MIKEKEIRKKMKELYSHKSIQELINFLELKGGNHKTYYHYTTWENWKKIYENESFLLTRGNSLNINDQHEVKMKGYYDEWGKTYIASFAFGSSKNMAMWGLYGLPWEDAIRIAIPQNAMKCWFDSIETIQFWEPDNIIPERETRQFSKVLNDIVYADGKKTDSYYHLTHANRSWTVENENEFLQFDEEPIMTGYIKNYAWHYENEVRLKIKIDDKIYGSEKIRINIPKAALEEFEVTTGPCFQYKNDNLLKRMADNNKLQQSGFRDMDLKAVFDEHGIHIHQKGS